MPSTIPLTRRGVSPGNLLLTVRGDPDGTERAYRAALRFAPRDADTRLSLGVLLHNVRCFFVLLAFVPVSSFI